jgi:hypothetical protein
MGGGIATTDDALDDAELATAAAAAAGAAVGELRPWWSVQVIGLRQLPLHLRCLGLPIGSISAALRHHHRNQERKALIPNVV